MVFELLFIVLTVLTASADSQCLNTEFKCLDGPCISNSLVCNRKPNCADGSDEDIARLCRDWNCLEGQFKCAYGYCIDNDHLCNIYHNCRDGSDENLDMCRSRTCPEGQFKCNSGQCISNSAMCNNKTDCIDSSDEGFNLCSRTTTQLVTEPTTTQVMTKPTTTQLVTKPTTTQVMTKPTTTQLVTKLTTISRSEAPTKGDMSSIRALGSTQSVMKSDANFWDSTDYVIFVAVGLGLVVLVIALLIFVCVRRRRSHNGRDIPHFIVPEQKIAVLNQDTAAKSRRLHGNVAFAPKNDAPNYGNTASVGNVDEPLYGNIGPDVISTLSTRDNVAKPTTYVNNAPFGSNTTQAFDSDIAIYANFDEDRPLYGNLYVNVLPMARRQGKYSDNVYQ